MPGDLVTFQSIQALFYVPSAPRSLVFNKGGVVRGSPGGIGIPLDPARYLLTPKFRGHSMFEGGAINC